MPCSTSLGTPRQELLRALRIPALSPGWQASFQAWLEKEPGSGNAGLAVTSPPPAWPGFRQLSVTAITRESDSVISIRLKDPTGAALPAARPGQWLAASPARYAAEAGAPQLLPLRTARRRLLPHRRQARTRRRRQRLSAHPPPRRRPAGDRSASWHLHPRPCC